MTERSTRTLVRCGQLIAFDGTKHRLLNNTTLTVEGNAITAIGPEPQDQFDTIIDARDRLVSPGFVNLHLHSGSTIATRLVTERRYPSVFNAGYLAFSPKEGAVGVGRLEDANAGGLATAVELLKSGCTTIVDLGQGCDPNELVHIFGRLGLRTYIAPGFRSGYHVFDSQGRLSIHWTEDEGFGAMQQALDFIDEHHGSYDGRVNGILFPYQGDTCTDRLLMAAKEQAVSRGLTMQMHGAQSLYELHEMMRRTGKTTIQHFADLGFLGPELAISHCPFVTGHPSTGLPGERDLELLGEHRVTVCHNPSTIFRRGHLLRSFSKYQRYGINMAIGTDHYPRDMVYEMRLAALMGKVTEDDPAATTTLDAFNAGTIGSADALQRPDLGRLYPGAKADLIVIDLKRIGIVPLRDPVQDLVLCSNPADIKLVMVDGRVVCENGVVPGIDEEKLLNDLQRNADAILADVPTWHWAGATVDGIAPRFLEPMESYSYKP